MAAKKLLFVLNDAAFFVSHRLPLAIAARLAGYEVHVAVPESEPAVGTIRQHANVVHAISVDRSGTSLLQEGLVLISLLRLYREIRPDIVHHVTIKPVLYGSLARRFTGGGPTVNAVPGLGFIFLARGFRASARRRVIEQLYHVALQGRDSIAIFQNPDDRAQFVARGLVAHENTVLIRGSGVDLEAFPFTEEPAGADLVVLPARMLYDKGVREFVEAARIVRATQPSVRFALVGRLDANRSAVPESVLNAWIAEGIVEWWGQRSDMPAVLQAAAIVCLPSYREGVPKALIEAAATGRAIVTTDVAGCREVVTHELNGLLVPPEDANALAAAIVRLLVDNPRRQAMGRAGRVRAETEFGVASVVEATLALYRKLCTI